MTTIDFGILIRALAISMVVFNHAYIDRYFEVHGSIESIFYGFGFGGGAAVLMLISGYNFAGFILAKNSVNEIQQGLVRLGLKILIPSFFCVLFFFALLQKFSLSELLFFRNFITLERVSKFPTWYPQVIIQIFIFLWLIFPIFETLRKRSQYFYSLLFVLISVCIFYLNDPIMNSLELGGFNTPMLYLWNFVIGWMIYNAKQSKDFRKIILAIAIYIACLFIALDIHSSRFIVMLASGIGLLFLSNIYIPLAMKTPILIISQATFAIFLFHRFWFEVMHKVLPFEPNYWVLFFGAILASGIGWILVSAFTRSFAKI